jgi:hypothetical protein
MLLKKNHIRTLPFKISFISSVILLSACGGSSSSSSSVSTDSDISGVAFAAAVDGASVSVTDKAGNEIAGPVISNASGNFTLTIPKANLSDELVFIATGGTYIDEATGTTTANGGLKSIVAASTLAEDGSISLSLSPESTLIHQLVDQQGLTLSQAHERFESAFGYSFNPHVIPVDATQLNAEAADDQRLAGLRAATFSQLTKDLGLGSHLQFELLEALAMDIADGDFNGKQNNSSIEVNGINLDAAIQGRFSQAMMNFRANGDNSGLNNAAIGHVPFAKTAISDSYIVTYVPGDMDIMEGKTRFSFRVTDHQGIAVTGLSPELSPLMNMAMHKHATPFTAVSEDSEEPGLYHATLYFLMASSMANGNSMGFWELGITLGTEEVSFYPKVMMAMGDGNVRANLKSQSDCNSGMMNKAEKCSFILFKDSLQSTDTNYRFSIFIAAKKNMMNFPALNNGLIVDAESLEVTSIKVEMSTDEMTWVDAVSEGDGIWSTNELTGLSQGEQASIYVRLTVNGQQATDDGNSVDGTADNAIFSVTPSSSTMK